MHDRTPWLSFAQRHPRLRFMTDPAPTDGGGDPKPTDPPAYTPPATQADLDRIVESRLARDREKYKDYDDLKAAKTKYDEHLESQKTEQQKALDAAKAETGTEVTQKFLKRLVTTETKSIATSLGFNDPADALQAIGDELPVKDEEPDTEAIKKAVEKLATDKPYLVGTAPRRAPGRQQVRRGEPLDDKDAKGKGRAAAALRQLGAARRSS